MIGKHFFSSVQSLSHVWLCDPMNRSMPGLPVHHQLPESTQTPSNHLILYCLLLLLPQSFPASGSFPMSQLFASGGQSIGVQLQHFLCLPIWALKFGEAKWVIVNNRNASDISPSTQSWKGQSFTRVLLSCCNNLPHAVWQSLYPSSPSVTIERGLLPICIPVQ